MDMKFFYVKVYSLKVIALRLRELISFSPSVANV